MFPEHPSQLEMNLCFSRATKHLSMESRAKGRFA
jgi:hypothetical protein